MKNPKHLSFRFHSRALQSLGRDLVTDDEVAVMELVKNSYDAMATSVHIHVHIATGTNDKSAGESFIEILDDGHGMDYKTIENVWCVIATPHRQYVPVAKYGRRSRHVVGEKGLGRLSAARLGSELEVTTKTDSLTALMYSISWDKLIAVEDLSEAEFSVAEVPADSIPGPHGTRLRITDLASVWSNERVVSLRENLSRLVSPFTNVEDFSMRLGTSSGRSELDLVSVDPPPFMTEPKYRIQGSVNSRGTIRYQYQYKPIGRSVEREQEVSELANTSRFARLY